MPDQDNFSDAEATLRKIQVVILRLILDSNSPTDLRGALQAVPEGRPVAFCGEKALLAEVRGASYRQLVPGGRLELIRQILANGSQLLKNPISNLWLRTSPGASICRVPRWRSAGLPSTWQLPGSRPTA